MQQGYYHSKLSFGTVDGPGIRYVLFLAGCQLGCAFCHNPDTWARGEQQITADEVLTEMEDYRNFYESSGGGLTVSGGEPLLQPEFLSELLAKAKAAGIITTIISPVVARVKINVFRKYRPSGTVVKASR